MKRKKNNSRET